MGIVCDVCACVCIRVTQVTQENRERKAGQEPRDQRGPRDTLDWKVLMESQ